MARKLGIYIHIPFCASKCGYCDFYSLADCPHLMDEYQTALLDHLAESAPSIKQYEVDTVYFGGGTPSFYGADRIIDIFNALKLNGNVRLDSEVTVECNPDSTSFNALKLLRQEGVNRLSIGIQAADSNLLKLIGRRHNFQQAEQTVKDARKAGFENISVDLIYGLPSQTRNDWAETLARIVTLHPEHVSCYGLRLEEGTPMYEAYHGSPILPDDDEQADMYCYAAEMLERYGYRQYEVSNFSAPGFESRHNLKYWNMDDYMGFGPGAHSCVGTLRYSFVRDLRKYIMLVDKKESLIDEYQRVDPLERAVEYIMLGMRMRKGISERDYRVRTQCDWRPVHQTLLAFRQKGWAVEEDGRWHFTVPGFLISNTLIGILLESQAAGRIEGTPWLSEAFSAEAKISVPPSEEEMFAEMYRKKNSNEETQ